MKRKRSEYKTWNAIGLLENITENVLLTAVIRCSPLKTDVKPVAQSHIGRKCITFIVPKIGIIDPHLFTKVLR